MATKTSILKLPNEILRIIIANLHDVGGGEPVAALAMTSWRLYDLAMETLYNKIVISATKRQLDSLAATLRLHRQYALTVKILVFKEPITNGTCTRGSVSNVCLSMKAIIAECLYVRYLQYWSPRKLEYAKVQ
ncbi:hypothetical protein CF319_g3773 [Tilletia indica]|uniref:Uncharacterized protein n=1 Tax=Tilletia indica TaxID=43049 RepID=A0A177TN75_9BASI|nr:hypothetical protein CF319_g3773 [Tilletia indica]KAE8231586.1 hypothetical protein CF326_g3392 [Tilletia indica]KAE8246377.1 hypothetical protein A4X13_0g5816 [Tilletia indica]